jgi:hypothetical protein
LRVSKYSFETKTVQFHVCCNCGIVPLATSQISGRLHAVVNVNTVEGIDSALFRHATAAFDGENEEVRLARQQRNWIANVEYVGSGT